MPPLRRNLAPRLAMHSRANKSRRRRRAMRLQVLVVPLCLLSAVTALALRLAFCDAQSTRLGHAKTLRAAGHLQGGRRTDSTGSRGPTGQRGRPSCELAQCRVEAGRGGCVDSRDGRTVRGELSIYANTRRAPAARLPEERGRNAFVLSTWGWTPRHHCQGEGRQAADTSRSVRGSRKLLPLRPATTMIAPAQLPHRSSSALFHSTLVVHTRVSPRSGPENGLQYAASYHNDEIPRRRLRSKCLGSCSDSGLLLPLSSSEAAFMASARRRDAMSTTLRASAENEDGECLETSPPAWAAGRRSPLLITIGPQCAGKTTLLRSLAARARTRGDSSSDSSSAGDAGREITTVTDVSIDDHPSVYYKIPTRQLIEGCAAAGRGGDDGVVGGRSLSDRLAEPGCLETRLVALRLLGSVSARDFADSVQGCGGRASTVALQTLGNALEGAVSEDLRFSTQTVDVFIRENLFPKAIFSSQGRLESAARDEAGIVAWGNTNTQARDFRGALEQAELTGRPVRFVRWGHELPLLSLEELSRRNVYRFASTGRYVETAAIEAALVRIDKLYASTSGGEPAQLALAAGFLMDASGRVAAVTPPAARRPSGNNAVGRGRSGGAPREGSKGRGTGRGKSAGGGSGGTAAAAAGSSEGSGSGGQKMSNPGASDSSGVVSTEAGVGRGHGRASAARDSAVGAVAVAVAAARVSSAGEARWRPSSSAPPIPGPLPVGRLTVEADRRSTGFTAVAPLAQGWTPRGGTRLVVGGGAGRGKGSTGQFYPSTVMFGSQWGRNRGWRRTGYTESDVDPLMSSCAFRAPANATKELRRNDLDDDKSSADFEEMDLVRRIRSFRARR